MKPRIRNSAVALAAGVAIFALPTAANAAVTPAINATQLTLTSDGASDNITLGVAGVNISHNLPIVAGSIDNNTDFDPGPADVKVPNNGTFTLVVDGGDGNDNINVSAPTFLAGSTPSSTAAAATTSSSARCSSISSTAARATTASRPSAATRTSSAATATT